MKLQILVPQYKETDEVVKPLLDSIAIQQSVPMEEIGVIIENIDPPIKDYEVVETEEGVIDGNLYGSSFTIGKGERFAQMRLVEVPLVHWLEVDSLGTFESDHGKGFGSTGAT